MNDRLDQLLAQMANDPSDRNLDSFELEVAGEIRRLRVQKFTSAAITPVRFASVGMALAVGVTVGGVVARRNITTPPPLSPFAVAADLAPSTLLESRR
jgi:hypothetical protein